MNVKQYLNQLYRLDEFIESNQEELERLKEVAVSIKAMNTDKDVVQESSTSTDAKYVDIIAKIDELERLINEELNRFFTLKMEIRTFINGVKDADERLLLKYKYINFYTWNEIHVKMNMSIRNVHRIHKSALNSLNNLKVGTLCH